MKRLLCVPLSAVVLVLSASQALAQSAPAAPTTWVAAVDVGAASVERVGAAAGARLERPTGGRLSLFVRTTWMADTVSRRRLAMASSLAAFTSSARGVSMTADVTAPAWYAGAGAAWRLRQGAGWYPTVFAEGGVARVTFKPGFSVSGSDVTGNLAGYGITLGSDLSGSSTKAAFGGGIGVVIPKGRWQIESQARFLQIQTPAESSRVATLTAGIGYRF